MRHLHELKLSAAPRLALVIVFFLFASAVGHTQSCALCYTQAAGAGHRVIQGLRTGILVLIVPPMFMSVGITVLAYRKRNRTKESGESSNDW